MIKQILFDCGGVLVEMKFWDLMLQISGSREVADYFTGHIWCEGSPWLRYDSGELNTEEVKRELKTFMPRQYHGYLDAFVERLPEALPVMEGMEALVDELRSAGYPCYLLSNFSERFEEMPACTPVLKKLDGMVISYKLKMLKPDPAIFLYTLEHFGIEAEQTLFVDDNSHNVEAAKALGMGGYLFKKCEQFREYLREQGILP